jgi:hypothetical protein
MSQSFASGLSKEIPVPTGQSVGVFVSSGAYSLSIKAGPGKGTVLATNSTTSQTYGPWASNVVLTLHCEAGGDIDVDVGVSPADDRVVPVTKTGTGIPYFKAGVGIGAAGGPTITSGAGTPEAAVTAPVGSLFVRTDGGASTTLYVKQSGTGNTGWVAK